MLADCHQKELNKNREADGQFSLCRTGSDSGETRFAPFQLLYLQFFISAFNHSGKTW